MINRNLQADLKQRRNGGEQNLFVSKGRLVTIQSSQNNDSPPSASPMEESTLQSS